MKKSSQAMALIGGILFVSLNLRLALTDTGPLLGLLRRDLSLSATEAGLITTLPLVAFALFSPFVSRFSQRLGIEKTVMLGLVITFIGMMVRVFGSASALLVGTFVLGIGIAVINVLLPGILKSHFPDKITTLTAIYVLVMGLGSALSASIAIPLTQWAQGNSFGLPAWSVSLGVIAIVPILSMLFWLPQCLRRDPDVVAQSQAPSVSFFRLLCSPITWYVMLFLGLNSFLNYAFVSWLPSILVSQGHSSQNAGFIQGIFQIATALPTLILIPLMRKYDDKKIITFVLSMLAVISILGLIYLPQCAIAWAIGFGVSSGGGFIMGLSFISLRTKTAAQATCLSGGAQSFGYLFSATAPILLGYLHKLSGHWQTALWLCFILAVVRCVLAWQVGIERVIDPAKYQ